MRRFAATSTALVLAVVLAACGGSSDDAAQDAQDEVNQQLEDLGIDTDELDELDQQSGSDSQPEPPEFFLTGTVDPPAGWVEQPAWCTEPETKGLPFFDYHVPAEWERVGTSHGGSGGVGGSGDNNFEVGDAKIELEVSEDHWTGDKVANRESVPEEWTSWDYEITTYTDDGDEVEEITYEEAGSADVDGESVDLWYLDETQSESVNGSEYKTRLVFGDVPAMTPSGDDRQPASATVTFNWSAEDTDFTEEEAAEILSTFRLAECAQEGLTELYETLLGVDFSS